MPIRPPLLALLTLAATALAACGERGPAPKSPPVFAVTEVPLGAARGGALPAERYPPGSRLLLRTAAPPAAPRLLAGGFVAAGGAVVAPDGRRLLFTGKRRPGEPYGVFLWQPEARDVVRVSPPDVEASEGAFLADGRVVFSATLSERGPRGPARALFVARIDDPSAPVRITFGAGLDLDPTPLADGRILYAAWLPEPAGLQLFTVHPDGTGAARLPGAHGPDALRPRELRGGQLAYVRSLPGEVPELWLADPRAPGEATSQVELGSLHVLAAEPTPSGGLLVVGGETRGGPTRLCEICAPSPCATSPEGTAPCLDVPPEGGTEATVTHAVVLAPRAAPRGQLSIVDAALRHGSLLAIDARAGEQRVGVRVRLTALDGAFAGGIRPAGHVLGEAALAADGSMWAEAPADTPLLLDLLDAEGRVLVAGRSPFWLRPNEVRGCIGCHEDPETAPPNVRPLALAREPVDLRGGGGP